MSVERNLDYNSLHIVRKAECKAVERWPLTFIVRWRWSHLLAASRGSCCSSSESTDWGWARQARRSSSPPTLTIPTRNAPTIPSIACTWGEGGRGEAHKTRVTQVHTYTYKPSHTNSHSPGRGKRPGSAGTLAHSTPSLSARQPRQPLDTSPPSC